MTNWRRFNAVQDMPLGLARTVAAEALVADLGRAEPTEVYAASLLLLTQCYQLGETPKCPLPMTKALRLWDDHPELFDTDVTQWMLIQAAAVIDTIIRFAQVPRESIEAQLADLRRRVAVAGYGLSAPTEVELSWARHTGAADLPGRFQVALSTPRDALARCEACIPGLFSPYLIEQGRLREAVDMIERRPPNTPYCSSEPSGQYSMAQLALLDLGEGEQAVAMYRKARASLQHQESPKAVPWARHAAFLVRTGNTEAALAVLGEQPGLFTTAPHNPEELLDICHVVARVMATVVAAGGGGLPVHAARVPAATAAQLGVWCRSRAASMAAAFDARNATTRFAQLIADIDEPFEVLPIDLAVLSRPDGAAAEGARTASFDAGQGAAELFTRAEFLARRDMAQAGRLYRRAALGFANEGDTERAGMAWAEAAHCVDLARDLTGAIDAYRRAWDLLSLLPPTPALLPVGLELVRTLGRSGRFDAAVGTCEGLLAWVGGLPDPAQQAAGRDAILEAQARALASQGKQVLAQQIADAVAHSRFEAGDMHGAAGAALLGAQLRWDAIDPTGTVDTGVRPPTPADLQQARERLEAGLDCARATVDDALLHRIGDALVAVLRALNLPDEAAACAQSLVRQ